MLEGQLQDRITCAAELAGWEEEKASLINAIVADREKKSTCVTGIKAAGVLIEAAQENQNEVAEERATLIRANPPIDCPVFPRT